MERFNLLDCLEWITQNSFHYICLYFNEKFYSLSSSVLLWLQEKLENVKFVIVISNSSGPETISTRIRDDNALEACIFFGSNCLCSQSNPKSLPVFFMALSSLDDLELEYVISSCQSLNLQSTDKVLLLADLTNQYVLSSETFLKSFLPGQLTIASLLKPNSKNWHFQTWITKILKNETSFEEFSYPYFIKHYELSNYDLIIFIGQNQNLELIFQCKQLLIIDPQLKQSTKLDGGKELRKRVSLIEKFKSSSRYIGFIFINYQEPVNSKIDDTQKICRSIKQTKRIFPYFLTLNYADFKLRLGNFTQLNGFVLINACQCNYDVAMNVAKYLHPVIFWKEFLIACGRQPINYGGVEWNQQEIKELENDINNDADDDHDEKNLKLVDKDFFKKTDFWYGLLVDPGSHNQSINQIIDGQHGLASSYNNEQELF